MARHSSATAATLLTLVLVISAAAQPRVARHVISAAPVTSSTPALRLAATMGQPVVGFQLSLPIRMAMGFWAAAPRNGTASDRIANPFPSNLLLFQNYPNPATDQTSISFATRISQQLRLVLYDIAGRIVDVVIDGPVEAGTYLVRVDTRGLPNGRYLYVLQERHASIARNIEVCR